MVEIEVKDFIDIKETKGKNMFSVYWLLHAKASDLDELKVKMEKERDKRGPWPDLLYSFILKNIKFDPDEQLDIDKVTKEFGETIICMADKIKKTMSFDEKSKQKAINEYEGNKAMKSDLKKKRSKKK